jgi:hypothetical protein
MCCSRDSLRAAAAALDASMSCTSQTGSEVDRKYVKRIEVQLTSGPHLSCEWLGPAEKDEHGRRSSALLCILR